MALPTGAISMNDLRSEFGISGSISLSQVYRGGSEVPDVSANNGVSTSGTISLGGFQGGTNNVSVTYTILGGGGGGGFGNQEDGGTYVGGSYASAGGTTSLSGAISVSAGGGAAGASHDIGSSNDYTGTSGGDNPYGIGGSGGVRQQLAREVTGDPSDPSYVGGNGGTAAGGGGGGGDRPSAFDSSGFAGRGGSAGSLKSGTVAVPYKSSLTIVTGSGGSGGNGPWGSDGGRGGDGYAEITRSYNTPIINTYTTSGSRTITV